MNSAIRGLRNLRQCRGEMSIPLLLPHVVADPDHVDAHLREALRRRQVIAEGDLEDARRQGRDRSTKSVSSRSYPRSAQAHSKIVVTVTPTIQYSSFSVRITRSAST